MKTDEYIEGSSWRDCLGAAFWFLATVALAWLLAAYAVPVPGVGS